MTLHPIRLPALCHVLQEGLDLEWRRDLPQDDADDAPDAEAGRPPHEALEALRGAATDGRILRMRDALDQLRQSHGGTHAAYIERLETAIQSFNTEEVLKLVTHEPAEPSSRDVV